MLAVIPDRERVKVNRFNQRNQRARVCAERRILVAPVVTISCSKWNMQVTSFRGLVERKDRGLNQFCLGDRNKKRSKK